MSAVPRHFKRIPHWVAVDYASLLHLQERIREWLLSSASLTLRIKNHCRVNHIGNFSVRVLGQGMGIPSNDEVQRLKLKSRRYALIREVLLYCGETPVIFARTVIPVKTLTGAQRQLGHLGNRPLGEFLFSQPYLQRDAMEVAVLNHGHHLFDSAILNIHSHPEQVWARRSIFRLQHKPLLVAEVFLPDVFSQGSIKSFDSPALTTVPSVLSREKI
ncbi:MAG: chorismate lyase [Gammaproteobacteria bacterium]|nr:chorismate lyase [Gammaproteobacteria bacterium]